MQNPYMPIEATIEKVIEESPTITTYVLKPAEPITFLTGQFIELTVPGIGEGPFTPSSDPDITNSMEVTIMNVGKVTSSLRKMSSGEKVGLRGPYGKGYPLDDFKGKEIFIVGGGVGLAPLRSFLYALFSRSNQFKKIYLRYGARTPNDIIYKEQIPLWAKEKGLDIVLTVDKAQNGWKNNVGVVTTILENIPCDIKNSVAIVCGPPIMMKFTTFKLIEKGFADKDIYLSMEKNMSCGIGKCGHCGLGHYYVCKDGPVFTYDQIKDMDAIWD